MYTNSSWFPPEELLSSTSCNLRDVWKLRATVDVILFWVLCCNLSYSCVTGSNSTTASSRQKTSAYDRPQAPQLSIYLQLINATNNAVIK